jgi:hypothetical protein
MGGSDGDDLAPDREELELSFRNRATHWLTRTLLLRALGLVYAVAYTVLVAQLEPLLGARGLLPVSRYLASEGVTFWQEPSIFWWHPSDAFMVGCAWLGLAGALLVVAGATNAVLMAALWLLYLSFVHVGQTWYGYGWELLLLEAGFLAIFLCPLGSLRPFDRRAPAPALVVWLYRWLAFRLMVGAGLIKLRGDACWRDLTCLDFHYETQPVPSPLSWLLHQAPPWFHAGGVIVNHLVELVVPFAALAPRPYRTVAGVLLCAFQVILILSGNLSFLNWLTLAVCLACFDDEPLLRALPRRLRGRARAFVTSLSRRAEPWPYRRFVLTALGVIVGLLSLNPVINMLSPRQRMNRAFEPLHLVNSYGAFGSVSRVREEIVIEGCAAIEPTPAAPWQEYELPCKPGDPRRRPCLITPYHHRLDWQAWFVPLYDDPERFDPWLYHLIYKLLEGDDAVRGLFLRDPFDHEPPRHVRVSLYRYRFTRWGEDGWWHRERVRTLIEPLGRGDAWLAAYLRANHLAD